VVNIAEGWQPLPLIENWIGNCKKVVVAGSTWHEDEKVLKHLIENQKELKWILAPHQLEKATLNDTLKRFPDHLLFSKLEENGFSETSNLLIIDCIGLLSRVYKYATVCFIGGGFSATGIHNTLEAAVYGKPLFFGPEFEEYAEAEGLINVGGALWVENALSLEKEFSNLINNQVDIEIRGEASKNYMLTNAGATKKVIDYIYKNRLLTR
jgi:3-deoxy-D-manno-octulosonic-acid transferase